MVPDTCTGINKYFCSSFEIGNIQQKAAVGKKVGGEPDDVEPVSEIEEDRDQYSGIIERDPGSAGSNEVPVDLVTKGCGETIKTAGIRAACLSHSYPGRKFIDGDKAREGTADGSRLSGPGIFLGRNTGAGTKDNKQEDSCFLRRRHDEKVRIYTKPRF